jgi:DNA-binding IclR family transcriptional regulator
MGTGTQTARTARSRSRGGGGRQIGSLVRGLKILEIVCRAGEGLKVSQIARAIGMPTSNLTLFLNSLLAAGYIIKNPFDGRYYASEKIVHIGSSIDTRYKRLEIAASEAMEDLHARFDENVLLAVLNGYRLQFISTLQSRRTIQILNNDDRLFVPHVTAGGRAILAFLPPKWLDGYFQKVPLERFTPRTITSKAVILRELQSVRELGYAMNKGEAEAEVMAVGAPIFVDGEVQASVVLQFPRFRYREADLAGNADAVVIAAQRIARALRA